ncbi:DUF4145 domain-containing protein [Candidatus Manganitrophus noduliformans]|uniref:DUF4145 domain-containing protein n=1 Tax=Candidatus Manganitrophus noduliformans TaxID=2606439 RepID=A0A7X6DSD3_9BACT|nr:DUF4145 domain-containing protein [Candidatus Manganitrophus noduliformans]NKE72168.1 DUF4145 domain-containing protein [Candidatus Manganitrophus noduliformans]
MADRSRFAKGIASLDLSHAERAVAFLWYYRQTQEFEERTASELANDLHDEGFPQPNVTRLNRDLGRSRLTIKGRRAGSFQIDVRHVSNLEEKYGQILKTKKVDVQDSVVPGEWVKGTRVYLETLVHQINGSYEYGFYDACAVLCRRLMESLIIEIYIHNSRHHEIQNSGVFLGLEKLIAHIRTDDKLMLGRNTSKTMTEVKQLGDTAAHDRVYITSKQDIDDVLARYRRMIQDLLAACGIRK